jgi:hypothetical protein
MQHRPNSPEPDEGSEPLGAGAAAVSSVFALLVGLVVGVITTFTHHQFLPWGLISGLLVVVAMVTGFRLVFDSRVVAAAAALGVVVASGILTLPGAGGTVLTVTDPPGWMWAIGPTVLSVIALAWPRPRSRPATSVGAVAAAE